MAALYPLPTLTTVPDMHPEADVPHRRLGNFRLVLLDNFGFLDRPTAVGALLRQRRFQALINLAGNTAATLPAVAGAGLASVFLRVGFGTSSGVRCRLAFRRPLSLFQQHPQPLHLFFEPLDFSPQPLVLPFQACYLLGVGFCWQVPALAVSGNWTSN